MQNTPNYGLKKPTQSDFYNVDDFNANADIIDTELANVNTDISNLGTNKLDKTGDASNVTNTFTQASTRANLVSGENQSTTFGKLMKWFADLKPVAWSGNASDLTEDANNRLVTDSEKTTWNGKASTAPVTTTANGLMISTDKSKLDGVATGANNYTHPSTHPPSIIVQDASNRFVTDAEKTTWNAKASTAPVTTAVNGLMISTDKSKLDGVATGANNYTHPSTHPPSVIAQDASNRFVTDTEKTVWNGKLDKSGGTMTGDIDMGGHSIHNVANGSIPADAVNKGQLDTKLDKSNGTMSGILTVPENSDIRIDSTWYWDTEDDTCGTLEFRHYDEEDGTTDYTRMYYEYYGFKIFSEDAIYLYSTNTSIRNTDGSYGTISAGTFQDMATMSEFSNVPQHLIQPVEQPKSKDRKVIDVVPEEEEIVGVNLMDYCNYLKQENDEVKEQLSVMKESIEALENRINQY